MADRTLTDPLEGTLEKAFPTRTLAAKALVRRCVSEQAWEGATSPEHREAGL